MTVFIFITHTKTFTYATKWRCICGCFTYASMVIYVCATGLLHWSNRFHKIFFGRVVLKLYGGRRKPYSIFLHMRNSFGRIMQTFCKCFAAQSAEHMRKSCIFSACAIVSFFWKKSFLMSAYFCLETSIVCAVYFQGIRRSARGPKTCPPPPPPPFGSHRSMRGQSRL